MAGWCVNMAVPDEDVVREVLSIRDRGALCRRAVEDALASVNGGEYPNAVWYRRKSTRRALVWEHSVDNAIAALSDDPGVEVHEKNDTRHFVFDDTVLLRFKKADQRFLSTNYPTLSAVLFHRHDTDLFGHEGYHRVEVIHVLDRFERYAVTVVVAAREGKGALWSFELRTDGAVVEQSPITPKPSPVADRVLQLVQPKTDKADGIERK